MRKNLSSNNLKTIAIIAMTVDHTAFLFIEKHSLLYYFMRMFGRLTAPIMTFLLVEGFRHTHNRKKYLIRLITFGLISQPIYFRFIYSRWPESIVEFLLSWNVMYTLAVSLIVLMWMDSQKKWTVQGIVLFALSFSLAGFGDWSLMIPAWAIFFFFTNKYKAKLDNTMIAILYVLGTATVQTCLFAGQYDSFASFSFQLGTVFAIIPILMYNGKRGSIRHEKLNRWFFYVYYPAHMAVLLFVQAAFS